MELEEIEYVDECPVCEESFLGATPNDAREHMTDEHGPIHSLIHFPTTEYKQHHSEEVLGS